MSRWQLVANGATVVFEGESPFVPSAAEIFAAEFRSAHSLRGLPVPSRPSEDLPTVSFSELPFDVVAVLMQSEAGSDPEVRLVASRRGREWDVTDAALAGADHAVRDGTWRGFRPGVVEDVQSVLAAAGARIGSTLGLRQYLDLCRVARDGGPIEDRVEGGAEAWSGLDSEEFATPQRFVGRLYPYQFAGYRWLSFVGDEGLGGILADEMGLGKTVQVITMLLRLSESSAGPSLVVCPATLVENWRRELAQFAPTLSVYLHRGSARTGFPSVLRKTDVTVTSYEIVNIDRALLDMVPWQAVVVDEAQAIKNPEALRTNAIKQLPRRCAVAVTGTPLENRLRDVWSICDFVMPGYLGDLDSFEQRFDDSVGAATRLEPFISPLMLRRRIKDVATDLPELIDTPEAIEMDESAAARYAELVQEARGSFRGSFDLGVLAKLRMFCAHPFLIDGPSGDPARSSTKYTRLLQILQAIADCGEKALIFCAFRKMLDLAVDDLNRRGLPTSWIDGRIPVPHRQPMIDAFSEMEGAAVLVLNPHAAGVGLNIVAANHVIHYTLEWNPAVIDQASARAYRRGRVAGQRAPTLPRRHRGGRDER